MGLRDRVKRRAKRVVKRALGREVNTASGPDYHRTATTAAPMSPEPAAPVELAPAVQRPPVEEPAPTVEAETPAVELQPVDEVELPDDEVELSEDEVPGEDAAASAPATDEVGAPILPVDADTSVRLHDAVVEALKTIFDPEIPVNIYELGLIYEVAVEPGPHIAVRMTLTSPNCPAAQSLPSEVKQKSEAVDGVETADVAVVWDPPWDPSMMTEEAQLELNLM